MAFSDHAVLRAVRKALGRSRTPAEVPPPPELFEPLVRLVHTDFGLPGLFAAKARENKIHVTLTSADDLARKVLEKVKDLGLFRILMPGGVDNVLDRLGVSAALIAAGVDLRRWDDATLDDSYDVDAGLTDAWAAVAETGSIVVRASPEHGRALSLVPAYHLVVIEPRIILPDLVDLFEKMAADNTSSATIIISGPSKTADIELNLVTGVHGPGHVEVFVLR